MASDMNVNITWTQQVTRSYSADVKLSQLVAILVEHVPDRIGEAVAEILDEAPTNVDEFEPVMWALAALADDTNGELESFDDINDVSHDVAEETELVDPDAQ